MINWIALIATFIVMYLPGLAASFAILKKTNLRLFDKLLLGGVLGFVLVPLAAFAEYLFFGLQFNTMLVLANVVILTVIAIAAYAIQGSNPITSITSTVKHVGSLVSGENLKKNLPFFVVPAVLLGVMLISFYTKLISLSSTFFEFDPYYYNMLTEFLIRYGSVPQSLDVSYFPIGEIFRTHPFVQYLTGSWTLLHQFFTGTGYDKETLILISNVYPPLIGAFLSLAAFWLLREQYDEYVGIIGAIFIAFTPQLVQKFASGVSELQPWGIYSAFLIFALYLIASKRKSLRIAVIGALTMLATLLGGQQYVWPFAVLAGYFVLSGVISFAAGKLDDRKVIIDAIFAVSGLIASAIFAMYMQNSLSYVPLLLVASVIPSVVLLFIQKNAFFSKFNKTHLVVAGILLTLIVSVLPIFSGTSAIGIANSISGIAKTSSPLGNTVAEETPTYEGVFTSAFGILNPYVLFSGLALTFALWAIYAFIGKKMYKESAIFIAAMVVIGIFTTQIAQLVASVLPTGLQNFALSPVFAPFVISLISIITVIAIMHKEYEYSDYQLLLMLIIFPVAFVGLSKIKFILHLSLVLALAAPVLLAEFARVTQKYGELFKLFKSHAGFHVTHLSSYIIAFTLLLGGIAGVVQATGATGTFPSPLAIANGLKESKISNDWLLAMSWLKNNTSYLNPQTEAACQTKYGHSCRVMSWWDYGHWTMFLGETKTVLDPTNTRGYFNQQVAHGFVDNAQDLKYAMDYHQATHVLVDFELIQKWGALVYLAGTCEKEAPYYGGLQLPVCPVKPSIADWSQGAGKSEYELKHYFETLQLSGQQCPFAQGLQVAQSSFGLMYCLSNTQLIPFDNSGLRSDLARDWEIVQLLNTSAHSIDTTKAYFLPLSQNQLVNVNPDFRLVNKTSDLIDASYVHLYFFNNLPGYKLVYTSPQGEVKIFEYVH